jgi:hypothetical protein
MYNWNLFELVVSKILNILALLFGLSCSIQAATIIFVMEQGWIEARVSSCLRSVLITSLM